MRQRKCASDVKLKIFLKNFRSKFRKIRYLHKSSSFSLIINSRIVIRITDERDWDFLQETETIFKKIHVSKILDQIFEKKVFS